MGKSEVYSWRVSPDMKGALERAARRENRTVGGLLDGIVRGWLDTGKTSTRADDEEQRQLHVAAARSFGTLRGGNPRRSEMATRTLRERLVTRHARRRPG